MKIKTLFFSLLLTHLCFAGPFHPIIDYIFPLPENPLISTQTTIILKLDELYISQINDLQNLISVTDKNGDKNGTVFFAADSRTIIFNPSTPFETGDMVSVLIKTSQFASHDNFEYTFYVAKNSTNEYTGLPKKTGVSNVLESNSYSPPRLINGVAVPSDFPHLNVTQSGETAPGRVFFASTSIQNGYGNYIVICENDGTPYFYRRYGDIVRTGNLTVHANGELSFHCYETFYIVLDHNFVEVDTIYTGHGYMSDDHELQILENGNILQVARQHVKMDMSKVVSGGKTNATVEAHHMQEMDREKNVIFEWNNWNFLDIRETYINTRANFVDFVHMNSIAIDYDGHYIISPREYKMIMKIDRKTGETIWELGGRHSDFTFLNEPYNFSFQHDARPVPGKPNHYTLFDNGRERSNFSRGVEYKLDLDNMTAEKVWEYRHSPDWYSGWMGSVQRFENGNTMIDFPGNGCRTVEVDKNNNEVWRMLTTGSNAYRFRRFEWDGKMLQPYFVLENMGYVVRLIFNKFGDTDVTHYNIYHGENAHSMTLLDTTSQTYIDINPGDLGQDGSLHYFKVTAVDSKGNESDFSTIEQTRIRVVRAGENAVKNGTFESTDNWELTDRGAARATGQVNNDGFFEINITNGGSNLSSVQLTQKDVLVMNSNEYVFEFDAYSSSNRNISAFVQSGDNQKLNYGKIGNSSIKTRLQHFSYPFKMNFPTDSKATIIFECGGTEGDLYIDNVSLVYNNENQPLSPLQNNWQNADIGNPSITGYAGMQNDQFVVHGSGSDIWGSSDQFHYVYQKVSGDADISAQVVALENSNEWAKAGVMIRKTLDASSSHAMTIVSSENGVAFQRRANDSGTSQHSAGNNSSVPYWVRLKREGNEINAYQSVNGSDWNLIGTEHIDLPDDIFIGLAVTAHTNDQLCKAVFDNVQLDTAALVEQNQLPTKFYVHDVYPNPFNPQTTIQFDLPSQNKVAVKVFDVSGRFVHTLLNSTLPAGQHKIIWEGANSSGTKVSTGVYFVQVKVDNKVHIKKVTLLY